MKGPLCKLPSGPRICIFLRRAIGPAEDRYPQSIAIGFFWDSVFPAFLCFSLSLLSLPSMSFHVLSIYFHFLSFPFMSFHFFSFGFHFLSFSFHIPFISFHFLSFSFRFPFIFLSFSFRFIPFHFLPRKIACREQCPVRCISIPGAIPQTI